MSGPPGSTPLVLVDAVSITIHGNRILERVSLMIAPGVTHVIVGRNGAGKSTLIQAMLGRLAFDGRIEMNWRRDGTIGYVPQAFSVDSTLPVTVRDFLALTRTRRPVSLGLSGVTAARVDKLLAQVGMQGKAWRPLAGLSGGELRRVLLAHALDPEPELLILDEPGAGLDDESTRWLEATLAALRTARRTTILMVSHDQDRVRRLADRVTVLDRSVTAEGTPAEVFGVEAANAAARGPQ